MDTTDNGDDRDDLPASQAYVSDHESSDEEGGILEIRKQLVFRTVESIVVKSEKLDDIKLEFNITNEDLFDYLKFKFLRSQDP